MARESAGNSRATFTTTFLTDNRDALTGASHVRGCAGPTIEFLGRQQTPNYLPFSDGTSQPQYQQLPGQATYGQMPGQAQFQQMPGQAQYQQIPTGQPDFTPLPGGATYGQLPMGSPDYRQFDRGGPNVGGSMNELLGDLPGVDTGRADYVRDPNAMIGAREDQLDWLGGQRSDREGLRAASGAGRLRRRDSPHDECGLRARLQPSATGIAASG